MVKIFIICIMKQVLFVLCNQGRRSQRPRDLRRRSAAARLLGVQVQIRWGKVMESHEQGDFPLDTNANGGVFRLLRSCKFTVKCCAAGVTFIRQM